VNASVVNVEFTTDGLFFTLGKMMPPLRDNLAVVPLAMAWVMLMIVLPAIEGRVEDADEEVGGAAGKVVVGNASVKSSTTEYLMESIETISCRRVLVNFTENCFTDCFTSLKIRKISLPNVIDRNTI
jgi:hypothetical protein